MYLGVRIISSYCLFYFFLGRMERKEGGKGSEGKGREGKGRREGKKKINTLSYSQLRSQKSKNIQHRLKPSERTESLSGEK